MAQIEGWRGLGAGTQFPEGPARVGDLPTAAARGRGPRRARILVMDDDRQVRDIMRRQLLILGFEVAESRDGRTAVDAFARAREEGRPFHAVILDLMVPGGLDGEETLAELLKLDPGVKALVCSGSLARPAADYGERGFSGVITKPYALVQLAAALDAVLAPATGS